MSVSFTWRPTDPKKGAGWGSGSSLNSALENAFGGLPITLTKEHIPVLEGISACGFDDVQELIKAIHECNSIDVDANW